MNIRLSTKVEGNFKNIMHKFDMNLFQALKPKFAEMEIVEFTGAKKGDKVHLRFLRPIKTVWISYIIENGENKYESFFVDEGIVIPFPLTYWKHRHVVRKITNDTSYIIDDITFKSVNFILSILMYPLIYAAFYHRKKIYKAYFK